MCITTTAWSQPINSNTQLSPTQETQVKDWVEKFVQRMLHTQTHNLIGHKSTATDRLLAENHYDIAYTHTDSFSYKYSGANGSTYDFNKMQYNHAYEIDPFPYDNPYEILVLDIMADTTDHGKLS